MTDQIESKVKNLYAIEFNNINKNKISKDNSCSNNKNKIKDKKWFLLIKKQTH